MSSSQDLPSALAKARQELQTAQIRVAELEAQLLQEQPNLVDLAVTENTYYRPLDAFRLFIEYAPVAFAMLDKDMRYLLASHRWLTDYRLSETNVIGRSHYDLFPALPEQWKVIHQRCLTGAVEHSEAAPFPRADGSLDWMQWEIHPWRKVDGTIGGILILSEVITERKQTEETLQRSEMRFRSMVEAVEDYAIYLMDTGGHVTSWNTGAERLKGYQSDEIIGQHFSRFFTPEDQQREKPQQLLRIVEVEGRTEDEGWRVRKDGSLFWADAVITALRNPDGSLDGFTKITRDLTQRKSAEEQIRKLHRTLGVLSDINQAIVRIRHLPSLFQKACEIAVEKGAFRAAWIGLFNPQDGQIKPVTHAGLSPNDLEKLVSMLNTEPLIGALRSGEHLIGNDIQNDTMWQRWGEEAFRLGYRATVALPLLVAGEIRGIFNLYAGETDFFDEPERRLMDKMAGDVAFAIEVAEQDEKRRQAEAVVTRYAKRMEILHQIDIGIINAKSTQAIIETALHHIRQLIPCQRANVGLLDMAKGEGVIFAVDYEGNSALPQGLRVPIRQDFFDGYDERHVKVVPDLRVLQETNPRFKQGVQEGLRSAINVLLMDREQPLGTLGLFANVPDYFTVEHQEIITEVGSQIAVAIRQMQLSEKVAQYTTTLEQKVAERTADLQATLIRVEAILNNSPDAILLIYADLTIQQTNSSFNTLFGSVGTEYLGQSFLTLLHPDDAGRLADLAQVAATQPNGRHMEVRAIRKDGSTFDAELTTRLIQGDGLVCNIRDITERKAQERQLRYHAALQENVSDAVIVTDIALRIQSWNAAAVRTYGWTAEEAIGQVAPEFLQIRFPVPLNPEAELQQFNEHGSLQQETIQRHKNGTDIFILGSATRLDDGNGVPVGVIAVNRDITERKQAEAALQNKMEEERQFQLYLKALHEIIIELTRVDQLDTFYKRAVELGRERLGFERLAMFLYNERDDTAIGTYGTDAQGKLVDERGLRFTPDRDGIMQRSFDQIERFYFKEETPLYNDGVAVGYGWNAAAALWNGARNLGWFVADNLLSHGVATKPLLDTLGLYALSVGTLLAQKQTQLELKESGALYRLLAENISDLIMRSTLTSECLYISPSVQTLLGYTPEELIGQQTFSLIHPDDQPIIWEAYTSTLERHDLILPHQYRAKHKEGHYIWLETVGKPIFSEESNEIYEVITSSRDVTRRRESEEALRESEEKFRLLLDAAPVATIISEPTGRISLVNVQAENLFGYSRDELTGQRIEILVPDYARDSHINNRIAYVAAPRVHPMGLGAELYAKRKDGSAVPVEIELSYIETRNGIIVMSFIMDITERKRIADELEQQRSFLRNVIDVSPNMIFVKDYDGRFVLANQSVATIYNTTIEALIGKTDADVNPIRKEVDDYLAADRLVITSGQMLFVEEAFTNLTGKVHWLQTTKVPIVSADGKSRYVLGVSTDITERKEAEEALRDSEEKYRTLVETMRGGLAVFDTELRATFVNDRFYELTGYSREEFMGRHPMSFMDAADMQFVQSHLNRRQNGESTTYELPLRHKDGHQIYLLLSGTPQLDKDGKFIGSIIVATDISIQKQAEEALRLALAKEKELGDLKTRFVSMASHEFRTPLASILAFVETLSAYRHRLSEEQIEQRLNKIKGQIGHLKDIMEDVLMLARIQAQRVEFDPEKRDLDALIRSVLDEFESRADIKHRLEYTVSEINREVLLDHKLMRHIINNLVSNAIKYSPKGTVVRIQLSYTASEVTLKVSDDGIGIPEADLPHLFEPFHRATNVGTISGTGLGLVITREAVELHNGTITVESHQDVGTTFLIRIPIAARYL